MKPKPLKAVYNEAEAAAVDDNTKPSKAVEDEDAGSC